MTTNHVGRRRGGHVNGQGEGALFSMGEVAGATAAADPPADPATDGAGLYRTTHADGSSVVRDKWAWPRKREKIAGPRSKDRPVKADGDAKPGMGAIKTAVWLLGVLSGGALVVSFAAQYRWIDGERSDTSTSFVEAGLIDLAMIVCSLLAFGLARNGQKARTPQVLVIVFAIISALQNYAAANTADWRSVLAYTLPPVLLAILVDVLVTTVRRHILHRRGETEDSGWLRFGLFLQAAVIGSVKVGLYLLRFAFSPFATPKDLRARVLRAAPTLAEIDARESLAAQLAAANQELEDQLAAAGREIEMLTSHGHDQRLALETAAAQRMAALRDELVQFGTQQITGLLDAQAEHTAGLVEQFTTALRQIQQDRDAELEGLREGQAADLERIRAQHAGAVDTLRAELASARALAVASPNGHGPGGDSQDPDRARRPGESKKAWIIRLYTAHPDAWDRARASKIATQLARETGTSAPTARNHIRQLVEAHHAGSPAPDTAETAGSENPA